MRKGRDVVAAESLRAALLAISGVASADVDPGDAGSSPGVRIGLLPDAEAERVSIEIQRVLADHGMRSRFSDPVTGDRSRGDVAAAPEPPPRPPDDIPAQRVIAGGLRSVAVEERADSLDVSVTLDDGRTGTARLTSGGGGALDAAVVGAVADAMGIEARIVVTEWMQLDAGRVVTVVLSLSDGALVAGAGVVRVGRAYAVGMAARAALTL